MITEQHVPQFRFKGFTDSWEQRKFSELFQKSSEKNTNLSFSRSQVLTGATMTDSDRYINSDDDYMKTYNVIHVGDILFEGHTSKQFAFGRFVLDDYRDGIVSHVFDIYRPKAKMNLSFWKYYIHDENVMRPILVRATSNARMLNALSSSEFLKQSVFVPSENEQAKTALSLFTSVNWSCSRDLNRVTCRSCFLKMEKMYPSCDLKGILTLGKSVSWGNWQNLSTDALINKMSY